MDSPAEPTGDLRSRLQAATGPQWDRPEDLTRMSIEGLWGSRSAARIVRSTGSIRVAGSNVRDHQARLDAAGHILLNFQRLVNAAGAAKKGIRSNRGALPSEVTTLTQLKLLMQPLPGSMVFEIGPETLPEAELVAEEGVAIFDQAQRQFVDECVVDAIGLVRVAHQIGPDADEGQFIQLVKEGGPRVASAVKEFAKGVEQADFEVDLEWREPSRATERATFNKADATLVRQLVVARELDQEEVTLVGTLVTLSTLNRWQIDIGDDHLVVIDPTSLPETVDVTQFRLSERIKIQAVPIVRELPGGGKVTTYRAVNVVSAEDT